MMGTTNTDNDNGDNNNEDHDDYHDPGPNDHNESDSDATNNYSDDEDSEGPIVRVSIDIPVMPIEEEDHTKPSMNIYDYQESIIAQCNQENILRVRRHRKEKEVEQQFRAIDYIQFANLGAQLGFSLREGDLVLKTVKDMCTRHSFPISMPLNFRTIDESIGKHLANEELYVIRIPLEPEIWGDTDINNKPLKQAIGVAFDVHQIIAERFLDVEDPKNIIFEEQHEFNNRNQPINNSFFTAESWIRACRGNIMKFGSHSEHHGIRYRNVIIPISISEDETALDKGRKKGGEPMVWRF